MDNTLIRRATESDLLFMDSIINNPGIRPLIGAGDHPLSFAPVLDGSICYVSDHGVILCQGLSETTFMALVAFDREGSGLHAMLAMREGLRLLFTETECDRVLGTVDPTNARMIRASTILGFKPPMAVGGYAILDCEFLGWAVQSPDCFREGAAFARSIGGLQEDSHVDLVCALGGMSMAAKNGLLGKGVAMFNTYAALSRTNPIRVVGNADRIFYGDKEITGSLLMMSEA